MQSFLRCTGEWNPIHKSVNKGIKKIFTLSLKLYKNFICFFKKKKKKKKKLLPGSIPHEGASLTNSFMVPKIYNHIILTVTILC